MKHYAKVFLLVVAVVLFLSLTACSRSASRAPVASPTPSGEAPFPFTTPDTMSTIKTQTAVALTPVVEPSATPEVVIATAEAPATDAGTEAGGGQEQPPAAPATDTSTGTSSAAAEIPAITRPETYALEKGEWPICIARRFDLDISSFFAQNGLNMNSKPGVGTVLKIPSTGNWSANYGARALKSHPATYSVVGGDTVNSIACKFGDVSPEQILAANGLSSAGDITSGMNLNIP